MHRIWPDAAGIAITLSHYERDGEYDNHYPGNPLGAPAINDEVGGEETQSITAALTLAKSKLEEERVISWGNNPFARGAFSHYPAAGVNEFSRTVSQPEGLLHFIGAHSEPAASGMEAAARSGSRGAQEALDRLSGKFS